MKQFLDYFQYMEEMDTAAWIAWSAVATFFGVAGYYGLQLIPKAVELYANLAGMREQNREGE